eukprot:541890-Hanusia_phi.AAC.2
MGNDGILVGANQVRCRSSRDHFKLRSSNLPVKQGKRSGGIDAFSEYMEKNEKEKKALTTCLGDTNKITSYISFKASMK